MSIVVSENEVLLYGTRFPLWGQVKRTLITPFPGKVVTGDYTRADKILTSEWVTSDVSGGLGILFQRLPNHQDRFWFGTLETTFQRGITLNTRVFRARVNGNDQDKFPALVERFVVYYDDLYAVSDSYLYRTSGGKDGEVAFDPVRSGSNEVFQADARIVDALVYHGRLYLLTSLSLYAYDFNQTNWVRYPVGGIGMAVHDSKLFILAGDGRFYWTDISKLPFDPGTNHTSASFDPDTALTAAGVFPLLPGSFRQFVNFIDGNNEPALYAVTDRGVLLYDYAERAFNMTPLTWPRSDLVGQACVWRGELYVPVDQIIYRYNLEVVQVTGPNKDDGLPFAYQGPVRAVIPGHAYIYCVQQYQKSPFPEGAPDFDFHLGYEWHNTRYFFGNDGIFGTILFCSPAAAGWHGVWLDSDVSGRAGGAIVASINGRNRLWLAVGPHVYYLDSPSGLHNPLQRPWHRYQERAWMVTSWFDAGWNELTKLALWVQVETANCSPSERIILEVGWDYEELFEPLAVITTNGLVEIPIPYEGGRPFRSVRFRITMERDPNDDRKSPVLLDLTLGYHRRPKAVYGFEVTVSTHQPYKGLTPLQLTERLLEIAGSQKTGIFVYRDGDNVIRQHRVLVSRLVGAQGTGPDSRGRWLLSVVEMD
jgi:hypothetical protein